MKRPVPAILVVLSLAACTDAPTSPPGFPASLAAAGGDGPGAPHSIAFHSDRHGNREIYLMNPDGSDVLRVTHRPETADFYPDVSPNGKWIVFTSAVGSGPGDIFLIAAGGAEAVNLTNTPTVNEDWARWSPSGQQIAFHRGTGTGSELYLLDLKTGTETRLTDNTTVDMWPEWSPDGQRLSFRHGMDVHVMDVRTGAVTPLTAEAGLNQMAAWSPNGRRLTFMSLREGYCAVFIMDADGGGQENLTPGTAGWCSRAPAWTRDGRILFMSSRPGTLGTAVFVMNPDGTGVTMLADAPGEDGGPTAR